MNSEKCWSNSTDHFVGHEEPRRRYDPSDHFAARRSGQWAPVQQIIVVEVELEIAEWKRIYLSLGARLGHEPDGVHERIETRSPVSVHLKHASLIVIAIVFFFFIKKSV